ncbi:MAG TPA: chemotaxis protein CheB [Lacipirellulaceae bacterium]|nr:chemotaxis protein CheB [Lacipirellulaceae bacterium]
MAKKKPAKNRDADEQPAEEHDRLAQPVSSEEAPRLSFPVVGVGASAGGLEAFIEFFEVMPDDSGIAFVLIQHLPPDRESLVASILAKHTRMSVHEVEDGMPVDANNVYVIRPGHTLTIKDGKLRLGAPLAKPGHNRPVDDFFRSLAEEQRERAIGIIMSGMGSNGSSGAEQIKAVGGVLIAQEPESAKYPSMPRHLIDTGNADFILRPNEMPAVLVRYASHSYARDGRVPETVAQRERHHLNEILTALRARTRRDFSGYKKPTILRRIQRRMSLNQVDELGDYAKLLRQNPSEASALSDDLMIHVTGFFRDVEAWETLRERVIVPLVQSREPDSSIRCWVAACSSGEEAFTLGMLLSEAAAEAGKSFDIKVFATDTADRSLSLARNGTYPLGIESEVPLTYLDRYFERDDSVYRIKREVRELVVFAPQNIIQDPPFSRLDICTCRNLLIYLEPELQRRILSLLHFGLREGGILFLGSSEAVSGADELFETVDKRARIFRRVGPTRHGTLGFAFPAAVDESASSAAATIRPGKPSINQLTNHLLLDRFTPAAVTIDREHRIVYFHGDTNPYLSQPVGEPTRELLMLARDHVRGALRTALQKAVSEYRFATARGGLVERPEGRFRAEVTVMPFDDKLAAGHFLVTFHEQEEPAALPPAPSGADASQQVARLQDELNRVRDELQSTIEELQSSNEEMRASNEEAMSVNEELQSTNEELETSKEELQSLNEELSTVNVQLQTKMEELEATTNDLTSLLSSTDIAVMFLDTKLQIRRFTPAISDLFDAIPADIGRPLSDLAEKFRDPDLPGDSQAVLDRLAPVEREIISSTGRVYLRRTLPYRTSDNRIAGVVITFVDISERKRAEEALRTVEDRFRLVTEGAPDFAMLLTDPRGRIVTWNVGAERLLGWTAAEAIGKSMAMIYPPEGGPEQARRELEHAAQYGRAADETWHVRKSGARLWGSGVLTAVRDANGELTGFVKIMRDDTARKQAEIERADSLDREKAARLEAENATRLKDQFLAMLSHELRTPIASILVWARMLRENRCDADEQKEGIEVIERSAEAQTQLLDDLLDTSRIASGKVRLERSETNFRDVVQLAIEGAAPLAKKKGVAINAELAKDCGVIDADPDRLRQVVGNLLNNAIKFTPSGGRIDVKLSRHDKWLELVVKDTGRGIEPDFLPRVFTAFSQAESSTTRSFGGLGLGLAISKELVELHGGTIHAESEGPDYGATFVVRLPSDATDKPAGRKIRKDSANLAGLEAINGAHILLVEDESQTRDALAKLLGKGGAKITAVGTAADAMEAFEKSQPDIIISDIGLPEEDGYQLLQRIRSLELERNEPPTPAIALTAFAASKDRRMAREAGYHKHIAKPVTPAVLIAAVTTLMADKERAINGE